MVLEQVLTDQKTQDKFGPDGLAELRRCLWAVDCQTCGRALGDEIPALYVEDMIAYAAASLHHPRCRAAQWQDSGTVLLDSSAAMLTYACRLVMMPFSKGDQPDPRPMLLVNPGLEMVILKPDDQQRWHVQPNAAFPAAGLVPPGPQLVLDQPVPGAVARLTNDSVVIAMQVPSATPVIENQTAASDEPFRVRIRELGGVLLGVTHALHPHQFDMQSLDHVLRSGQILLGWVVLHGVKSPATPRSGPTTTYALHWGRGHAFVGPLLAESRKKMTSIKARAWAGRAIGSSADQLLPWRPVTAGNPDDGWYTLSAISVKQYVLLQSPTGWTLLEALSRMDGTDAFETDNEAKAWAANVLRVKARTGLLTWESRPARTGTATLYTVSAEQPVAPVASNSDDTPKTDEREQEPYTNALLEKLATQQSYRVNVSNEVSQLGGGSETFQRWITNLWPGACQTCREPLGTKADISADTLPSGEVLISLHHSACRPSSVTPPEGVKLRLPSSVCIVSYLGDPDEPAEQRIPIMIVNPSCEQLIVRRDHHGAWNNATLDDFAKIGFTEPNSQVPPTIADIHAQVNDGKINVTIPGRFGNHVWSAPLLDSVRPSLLRHSGLAVSVLTKTLPNRLGLDELSSAFRDPEALVGWVSLVPK